MSFPTGDAERSCRTSARSRRRGFDPNERVAVGITLRGPGIRCVVAAVVYEKVGLRCLRSGWINLDLVWALALVATGAGTSLV